MVLEHGSALLYVTVAAGPIPPVDKSHKASTQVQSTPIAVLLRRRAAEAIYKWFSLLVFRDCPHVAVGTLQPLFVLCNCFPC